VPFWTTSPSSTQKNPRSRANRKEIMTEYKERSNYGGELTVEATHDGKLHIEITDSTYDTYDFRVEPFDQAMIALDILGPGDNGPLPIPPTDVSDEVLVNIARGSLSALRERREAVAREEADRKDQIEAIDNLLNAQPLNLYASFGKQLYARGFRAPAGGDA
jgi:hypothetical protein